MAVYIQSIDIKGLRGFGNVGHLDLGIPNGNPGSGLTILLGPNNAGKSTIIEAFNAISKPNPSSFTEGKRNKIAGDKVSITVRNTIQESKELRTVQGGGSETEWINPNAQPPFSYIFVLPSRRTFSPFFSKGYSTREGYITNYALPSIRGQAIDNFYGRIFQIQNNRDIFNQELKKVLDPLPDWSIEQSDSGNYYLKFNYNGQYHNSDGLGEGLVSLFFIIDALYDSHPGSVVVIDEPELSLHPSLQKKLASVVSEYAKDRQVVIATHSPYFVDWRWILNGAKVVRIIRKTDGTAVYQLGNEILKKIKGLTENFNNPHILGVEAKEVFFLEDEVILVEGQEDVIFYKLIEEQIEIKLNGTFYGWGVGGAHNMGIIAKILNDLGFNKVIGILDSNKEDVSKELAKEFLDYNFYVIPAEDVRTKPKIPSRKAVFGLLNDKGYLCEEFREEVTKIFKTINSEFQINDQG